MKDEKTMVLEAPGDDLYICTDIHEGQLPKFLEEAVTVCDMAHQQDMVLLATLTAVSYALPHIKLLHNQGSKEYYPNLMTLVLAPPASGKGAMTNVNKLIEPIDNFLKMRLMRAKIAADSSDVTFFESLMECGGNGFMIATEIDEISQAWKKSNGGYSSLFRQAFEHESWARTRYRGGKRIRFEVDEPRLSALLSGTENQMKPLLGRGENGLASRFLPYLVNDLMLFDERVVLHGDKYNENGALVVFERLGKELFERWNWLQQQKEDHLWSWTEDQATIFGQLIKDAEQLMLISVDQKPAEVRDEMLRSVLAMVNRMAVTLSRIGLILSMLRQDVWSELPEVIYCEETDFRTVITMGEKLFQHAYKLTEMMLQDEKMGVTLRESSAEAHAIELLDKLPKKFSTKEAVEIGADIGFAERTVRKQLNILLNDKKIARVNVGNYLKL